MLNISNFIYKKSNFLVILFFVVASFVPSFALAAVPSISSISPLTVPLNSADRWIDINGTNFSADSKVIFNNIELDPNSVTFVDDTKLQFSISADKLKSANTYSIEVRNPGAGGGASRTFYVYVKDPAGALLNLVGGALKLMNWQAELAAFPALKVIKSQADAIRAISATLAELSAKMLKNVFALLLNNDRWAITRECVTGFTSPCPPGTETFAGSVFIAAWNEVKKWANMLIVLGLLGIAIATILRFKEYEAKKLLPGILIVALLVNFSVVFVGLMIDASNIVMKELLGKMNGTETSNVILIINTAWNNTGNNLWTLDTSGLYLYIGVSTVFILLYLIVAVTLFWFALVFAERYVMLAILFILSPLAFVFYFFPASGAKKLFSDWWHAFIKWTFVGLGAAFFFNLGASILAIFAAQNGGAAFVATGLDDLPPVIFRLLIVMVFFLAGLKLISKSEGLAKIAMVAVAAIVAAIATGGASLIGSTAGGALKMAGRTKTGEKIKEQFSDFRQKQSTRIGGWKEKLLLADKGSTKMAEQENMAKRTKRFEAVVKSEKNNDVIARNATNMNLRADERAAWGKELVTRKKTHLITNPKIAEQVMDNIELHGGEIDAFTKSNPKLAATKKKIDEEMKKAEYSLSLSKVRDHMIVNPGMSEDEAKQDLDKKNRTLIKDKLISSAYKKSSVADIREYSKENFTAELLENVGEKRIREALKDMPNEKEKMNFLHDDIKNKGLAAEKARINQGKTDRSARENELHELADIFESLTEDSKDNKKNNSSSGKSAWAKGLANMGKQGNP